MSQSSPFRFSTYNLLIPLLEKSQKSLLFNGATGALDLVSAELGQYFLARDLSGLDINTQNALACRGYLTRDTLEEERKTLQLIRELFYSSASAKNYTGLTILPTYNCNCRCPYCFEKHRLARGNDWLNTIMTNDMADAYLEGFNRIKPLRSITFFGGEPFLPETRDIVAHICKKASSLGTTSFGAITNGTHLDLYLDLLATYPFRTIQITLDGPKDIHDKRRFLKDGSGTFDSIIKNIGAFLKSASSAYLSIRVNVDASSQDAVPAISQIFEEAGFTKYGHFSFYCHTVSGDEATGKHLDNAELPPELRGDRHDYTRLLEHGGYFPFRFSYCGANNSLFAIDPFGNIFTCWDHVGDDAYIVGQLDTASKTIELLPELAPWRTRWSDTLEPCGTCPYVGICGGGCTAQALLAHHSFQRGLCDEQAGDFRRDIAHAALSWLERNPTRAVEDRIPLTNSALELIDTIPPVELVGYRAFGILPKAVQAMHDKRGLSMPGMAQSNGMDSPNGRH